jgi:hypothetical protein
MLMALSYHTGKTAQYREEFHLVKTSPNITSGKFIIYLFTIYFMIASSAA